MLDHDVIDEPVVDTHDDTEIEEIIDLDRGVSALKKKLFGHAILTDEHVIELIKRAQKGDIDARNEIIEKHYKFLKHVAHRCPSSNIDIDDLIQQGVFGIIKAVKRFDVKRNIRFTTFASYWIYDYMSQYIMNNRTIVRIPIELQKAMNAIARNNPIAKGSKYATHEAEVKLLLETFFVDSIHPSLTDVKKGRYSRGKEDTLPSTLTPPDLITEAKNELLNVRARISMLIRTVRESKIDKDICETFLYHTGLKDGTQYSLGTIAEWYNITRAGAGYRVKLIFKHLAKVGLPYQCLKDVQDEFDRIEALEEIVQSI